MLASSCMTLVSATLQPALPNVHRTFRLPVKHEHAAIFRMRNERIANVFKALLSPVALVLSPTGAKNAKARMMFSSAYSALNCDRDNRITPEKQVILHMAEKGTDVTTEIFENKTVPRAFFTMTLPNVAGKLVTLIYNVADTWFISQTGNTALVAGVSLGMPVLMIIVAVGDAFGQGGASLITRRIGKKDYDGSKRLSSFCFWGALLSGAVLALILTIFRTPILYLVGADDLSFPYAAEYYRFLVLGAPFAVITTVPLNILRTEGLAKQSMAGNIIGSVVNLILDPIFILVFGWGAAGAAIATVCGYISSASYYIWVYQHQCHLLSINPRHAHASRKEITELFSIGIPACLTNLMQSFALAITNRFLLPYGTDKIAAYGIAYKVAMIPMFALMGFSFGSMSLMGYNYGAGNKERLSKILKFLYGFETALAVVMVTVMMLLSSTLMVSFLDDPSVVGAGTTMLRYILAGQVFTAFIMSTTCVFQATGQAFGAMLLSVNRQGILYILLLFILSRVLGYNGVIMAQPICDTICACMGAVILYRVLRNIFHPKNPSEEINAGK